MMFCRIFRVRQVQRCVYLLQNNQPSTESLRYKIHDTPQRQYCRSNRSPLIQQSTSLKQSELTIIVIIIYFQGFFRNFYKSEDGMLERWMFGILETLLLLSIIPSFQYSIIPLLHFSCVRGKQPVRPEVPLSVFTYAQEPGALS